MEPSPDPKQPKPAANTLAAKGTTDTQSADVDNATNLPRPESAPAAADSAAEESAAESQQATDAAADPAAANTQAEPSGESDPGASNTSNDEPL